MLCISNLHTCLLNISTRSTPLVYHTLESYTWNVFNSLYDRIVHLYLIVGSHQTFYTCLTPCRHAPSSFVGKGSFPIRRVRASSILPIIYSCNHIVKASEGFIFTHSWRAFCILSVFPNYQSSLRNPLIHLSVKPCTHAPNPLPPLAGKPGHTTCKSKRHCNLPQITRVVLRQMIQVSKGTAMNGTDLG